MSDQDENENKEIRCRELLALTREEHTRQRGFEGFYKLMYPVIFAYFRKQSVNGVFLTKEEAEDLAQETLLKIYETDKTRLRFLDEQAEEEEPVKYMCLGWVKRICYHKFLAKYAKPKDDYYEEDDSDIYQINPDNNIYASEQNEAERKENHDCFMTILNILRKKYFNDYELILLVTLGYSNAEIAKLLGKKKNVIATAKSKAITDRLRNLAYQHCLQEKAPKS